MGRTLTALGTSRVCRRRRRCPIRMTTQQRMRPPPPHCPESCDERDWQRAVGRQSMAVVLPTACRRWSSCAARPGSRWHQGLPRRWRHPGQGRCCAMLDEAGRQLPRVGGQVPRVRSAAAARPEMADAAHRHGPHRVAAPMLWHRHRCWQELRLRGAQGAHESCQRHRQQVWPQGQRRRLEVVMMPATTPFQRLHQGHVRVLEPQDAPTG